MELDYLLGHHARALLMIGIDFVKPVENDVATDEDIRL